MAKLTEAQIEAARTLVAGLKVGDRVMVDGARIASVVRYSGVPNDTHIYVKIDGLKRAELVHGDRLSLAYPDARSEA